MWKWFAKRPWIFIILFFLAYVGAWAGLIVFAVKNSPPPFEEFSHSVTEQPHES